MSKKILVVEDQGIMALDITSRLSGMGFSTLPPVGTGPKAVSTALAENPDLILMDIQLKGHMDGVEAAAEILKSRFIPIVFLTAHSDKTTQERARALTPQGYLLKPFTTQELEDTLDSVFGASSASAGL